MKTPIVAIAAAALIGSTSLVTAFYAPSVGDVSHVQLVQDKMKDEKMAKDKMMQDEKMAKEKMEKDKMMKDEKMKK